MHENEEKRRGIFVKLKGLDRERRERERERDRNI